MKAQLREHVRVSGETKRMVDFERVDWGHRVIWLNARQFVPFENVALAEDSMFDVHRPAVDALAKELRDEVPPKVDMAKVERGLKEQIDGEPALEWQCKKCTRKFPSRQAYSVHKGDCK